MRASSQQLSRRFLVVLVVIPQGEDSGLSGLFSAFVLTRGGSAGQSVLLPDEANRSEGTTGAGIVRTRDGLTIVPTLCVVVCTHGLFENAPVGWGPRFSDPGVVDVVHKRSKRCCSCLAIEPFELRSDLVLWKEGQRQSRPPEPAILLASTKIFRDA